MDILFASTDWEVLCHDDRLSKRALGRDSALKLHSRLDDLRAAVNLAACPSLPGKFHALDRDRKGQYAMSLARGYRLVFEPVAELVPVLPGGSIDLGNITTIRVVYIGNYHD